MPYSSIAFDNFLVDHIYRLKPSRILDVGVGSGKNGNLIKNSGYTGILDAIEPTESYIKEFNLSNIYNTVFPVSIQDFIKTEYNIRRCIRTFV
jgi:hypothetical protein